MGVDVRSFPVMLPSGVRYWTVLDENLMVVIAADAFLRHVRVGSRCFCGGVGELAGIYGPG
jgi:hypothetical protein